MKKINYLKRLSASPNPNIVSLCLRITAAVVMFPHGAQLMLGWFGGPGFQQAMKLLTGGAGLPWFIAFMVIIIQFFGSILLAMGLFTRFFAMSMFIVFVGMIFSGHIEHGFFMNWFGTQKGEGFEFHLLMLGICLSVFMLGGGRLSVDAITQMKNKYWFL